MKDLIKRFIPLLEWIVIFFSGAIVASIFGLLLMCLIGIFFPDVYGVGQSLWGALGSSVLGVMACVFISGFLEDLNE